MVRNPDQYCLRFLIPLVSILASQLLAMPSTVVGAAEAMAKEPGTIEIEKRTLESEKYGAIEHEIGTLYVRENRSDPGSRIIGIGFARYPSLKKEWSVPILYLMGGPGYSAIEPIKGLPPELSHHAQDTTDSILLLREFGDLILIDQRGFTNRGDAFVELQTSPPPKADEPYTKEKRLADYRQFVSKIVAKYEESEVDLRGYTILELADDVAELCRVLEYDKVVVFGGSFGSQWALAVMRRHPELVKRAFLCATTHPGSTFPLPTYILNAAKRRWKVIDKDPRFAKLLPPGGMGEAAETWLKKLRKHPTFKTRRKFLGRPFGPPVVSRTLGPMNFPSVFSHNEILRCYHGKTRGHFKSVFR
jgi:pimeloyl-ACP methyl ester carboxylesterase